MLKKLSLNDRETKLLTELVLAHQKSQRDLQVGLAFVTGARKIETATFSSLNGKDLYIEVPD